MIRVTSYFELARVEHFEIDLSRRLWLENLSSILQAHFFQMVMLMAAGNRTDVYYQIDQIK